MKDSTGSPEVSEVSKIGAGATAGCSSREAPSAEGVKNAVDAVGKIVGDGRAGLNAVALEVFATGAAGVCRHQRNASCAARL